MDKIIGEIEKSKGKKTVVSLSEWKGHKSVDVREYMQFGPDWKPTKKGVRIPIAKAGELVSLTEKAEDAIKKG